METKPVLFIDACVRKNSRTRVLANALLSELGMGYKTHALQDLDIKPLTEEAIDKRNKDIERGDYADYSLAKDFASAEIIVIAAPNYDASFPSLLKVYIENIYVLGLVTAYDDGGLPIGLCKAKKLYYVATSGGPMIADFGYAYVRELALKYFGVRETELIALDKLDLIGVDAESKLSDFIASRFPKR